MPWLWAVTELAVLKVGLSTHTPALQSIQLPWKSRKSAGQEDWNLKSHDSANISLLTPSRSRGVTAARPHKTFEEISEVSQVNPDQQADKFWCHGGELRQHLIKWNCSSPVQLLNVLLGKGSCSVPWILLLFSPQKPAGHWCTNRCCSRTTLPRCDTPSHALKGFLKADKLMYFAYFKSESLSNFLFCSLLIAGRAELALCVCLNRLALAGKLSTERVKREKQLLWCNPGPAARDPSPSSLPGGLSSITSGPWHC